MDYKTPLAIYIIWHPNFIEGPEIARSMYLSLCRDPAKPLARSMCVPVYFRSDTENGKLSPSDIAFQESEYVAVVPLITNDFVNDDHYAQYLDKIFESCAERADKRRVYPIAISDNAYNVSTKLTAINFIRAQDIQCSPKDAVDKIKGPLLHELCRLLMHMPKASEEKETMTVSPPIKLFISHSKHDETQLDAQRFRDHINSQTQLKTFFDTNDIAYGSNFGNEIKKAAKESALVVFQSDSYSDREWCRVEVLEAKSAGCPAVIVNAIEQGEKRAFPYLGNYPSIRFKNNFDAIIELTLEQVLLNLYNKLFLDSLTDLYGIHTDGILSAPPELFNFIQLRKKRSENQTDYAIVIYPDPPLGSEEVDLLNQLDDQFLFVTPLLLPSLVVANG